MLSDTFPTADVPTPIAYTVKGAARALSVSEGSIWKLLRYGELAKIKACGRTLIRHDELERWLNAHAVVR
jgi:excisionase family DNA binding protein